MALRRLLLASALFALAVVSTITIQSVRPRPAEASSVTAIAAGRFHSCALTAAGGVKCWGRNNYGQLGNGTFTDSPTPVDVSGLTSGVAKIAGGEDFTCAVTTGGGAKCWGRNDYGQLGDATSSGPELCTGSVPCSTTPVDVFSLTSGVAAIAGGGYHACALTTGGGAKCWGSNGDGELGLGNTTGYATPFDVTGLTSGVAGITAGEFHTCAVTTGGGIKCWGWNFYGQLGDGTNTGPDTCPAACSKTPVDVTGLTSGVTWAGTGMRHSCAVVSGGAVKCWGANYDGQLGDGTTTERDAPVDVCANTLCSGTLSGAIAVGGGQTSLHTCALMTEHRTKCWGLNSYGELNVGTFSGPQTTCGSPCSTTPVDSCADSTCSAPASNILTGALGELHSCGATTDGNVLCVGDNTWGQLGDGNPGVGSSTGVPVVGLSSKGLPPTATPTPVPTPIVAGEVGCHTGQTGGACPGGGPAPLGDNGPATSATLYTPTGVSENSSYLYIADTNNCRIRQVDLVNPPYNVTTVAGNGTCDYNNGGGIATSAHLNHPRDVFLYQGTLLVIADTDNCLIRLVNLTNNTIVNLAGVPSTCGYVDGTTAVATLDHPYGVAADASGVYIADTNNCRLRKAAAGSVSTIAGATVTGNMCGFAGDSGPATSAQLNHPTDVAFLLPSSLLVIADKDNNRIRTYDPATRIIATIAGTGVAGYTGDGGLATAAKLDHPSAVTALDYRVYIADTNNDAIRRVNTLTHTIDTVVLDPGSKPEGVAVPSGGGGAGEGEAAGFGVGGVTYSKPQLQTVGSAGQTPENTRPGNFVPASGCGLTPGVGTIDFALPAVLLGLIATRKRIGRFWTWFCTALPRKRRASSPEGSAT